jgi:hypothetical protein
MGTVFMLDAHTSPITNSEINDTIPIEKGDTQILNGSFLVNVPFGVPMDGICSDLNDLLTKKFAGLLAIYPGYTYIDYDEGIDGLGWDATDSIHVRIGSRCTTTIMSGGYLTSNLVSLSGPAPSAAILTWEVFEIQGLLSENPKNGVLVRRYVEKDADDFSVWASFDDGVTWTSGISDGVQFSPYPWGMGTDFRVRFANLSPDRRWIGSWAVIY